MRSHMMCGGMKVLTETLTMASEPMLVRLGEYRVARFVVSCTRMVRLLVVSSLLFPLCCVSDLNPSFLFFVVSR